MKRKVVLNKLLHAIKDFKHELVIVEGQRDRSSLLKLGLENIFVLNKPGTKFYSRVEALKKLVGRKEKKCAILTDFDKKGKFLYTTLKRELTKEGIKIDDRLRRLLCKAKVSHIEGLATFLSKSGVYF